MVIEPVQEPRQQGYRGSYETVNPRGGDFSMTAGGDIWMHLDATGSYSPVCHRLDAFKPPVPGPWREKGHDTVQESLA
jgi:hypothetical protein